MIIAKNYLIFLETLTTSDDIRNVSFSAKEALQNPAFPRNDLKPYAGDMREQGIFVPQRFKKGSLVGA